MTWVGFTKIITLFGFALQLLPNPPPRTLRWLIPRRLLCEERLSSASGSAFSSEFKACSSQDLPAQYVSRARCRRKAGGEWTFSGFQNPSRYWKVNLGAELGPPSDSDSDSEKSNLFNWLLDKMGVFSTFSRVKKKWYIW
jgi:hypothetical protein